MAKFCKGSALQARFSGPYVVESKLSDANYVVKTPVRKRKSRVCHINMLKPYMFRFTRDVCLSVVISVTAASMERPPLNILLSLMVSA